MNRLASFFTISLFCILTLLLPLDILAVTDRDDGTYLIDYTVIQPDNNAVSIANDYFQKPATLTIANGKQLIEIIINHSEWVTELKVASGGTFVDVEVVSQDIENDTRVVRFIVDESLSQPIAMQMHVTISSMVPIYDHKYTVRFDFDEASMQAIEPPVTIPSDQKTGEKLTNNYQLLPYFIAALLFVIVFLIARKLRSSRK